MNCGTMLNAYPDSLGGRLGDIVSLLEKPEMKGAFRSFYILPSVFTTDLDRGFSVISYDLDKDLTAPGDMERLQALGIVTGKQIPDVSRIETLFAKLNAVFAKENTTKEDVVKIMAEYLPNFEHIETGKSLDSKM